MRQEVMLRRPAVDFVWVTETSDPFFHWQPVAEVAASGQPVVVYSKNVVPVDFLRDNPRVAVGLTITGWGGTWLEPGVAAPEAMVAHLNNVAEAVGCQRLRLRVLIRGARFDVLPPRKEFLCTLIERLGLEDEAGWGCFAFALELLAEIGQEADIYAALAERKKLLLKALNHGRRQREHLAAASIEILVSRGQRLTSVDEAASRRQMAFIDRICLAVFGRIAHFELTGPEETLEFGGAKDITDLMRRLT